MAVRQDKIQISIAFLTDESKDFARLIEDNKKFINDIKTAQKEGKDLSHVISDIAKRGEGISKLDLNAVAPTQLIQRAKQLQQIIQLIPQSAPEYKQLEEEYKRINDQLANMRQRTRGVSEGMGEMRTTGGSSLGSLGSGISGLTSRFAPVIAAVTAAIGVIRGLGTAIGKAADLEQTTIAFETFLGSAEKAKKLIEELRQFSNVTPLEPEQVISAGRQLAAFGFETQNIIPILSKLGDVASGTGKDFNELVLIYGKAKASGKIQGDDLNQLAAAGIPIYEELGKVLGVNSDQIRKLGEDGKIQFGDLEKVFTNLTAAGGRFNGLMERQSTSLTGLLSTLKGSFDELTTNLGQAFLPLAKVIVSILIPAVDGLKNTFGPILQIVGEKLVKAFNFLKQAFQPIFVAFGNLKNALSGLSADFSYFDGVMRLIGAGITLASQYFGHLINTLTSAIVYIRKFDDATGFLSKTFEVLRDAALTPIKAITYLIAGLNGLVEFSKEAYTRVADGIELVVLSTQFGIAKIKGLIDADAAKAADGYFNKMKELSSKLGTGLGDAFTRGWNNALGQFTQVQDAETKKIEGRAALQTRTIEQSDKDKDKAKKEREKKLKEEMKQELDAIEGFYSRQIALQEGLFIEKKISESDFEKNRLLFLRAQYREQLAEYIKYGKDQELEAIKLGNKLIEVNSKLAPKQKIEPLAKIDTLNTPSYVERYEPNKLREDLQRLNEIEYASQLKKLKFLRLADEDFQKESLLLKLNYLKKDLDILNSGTDLEVEAIKKRHEDIQAVLNEIDDLELKKLEERDNLRRQALQQIYSESVALMGELFQFQESKIQAAADKEVDAIDKRIAALTKDEDARRRNAAAVNELEEQKRLIQEETAAKIKKLKKGEILTEGLLEVAKIWTTFATQPWFAIPLTALAAGRTALALKTVENGFAKGGHTGPGIIEDSSGFKVAGVVHEHEYVVPKWMTTSAEYSPIISWLEDRRLKGYAQGGYVNTTPTSSAVVPYATQFSQEAIDKFNYAVERLSVVEFKTKMVYSEFESINNEVQNSKSLASY